MATVYRGVQDGDPREVAIKVMHPELARDATFARRFRREARAASALHHPSTVRIIDYGVDGLVAYIAMELLSGRDLFDVLTVERRLSEARAARILIEVCDALTSAHAEGIVHRDLKPENIMLLGPPRPDGREQIKVLDFGIAKILDKDLKDTEGEPPSSGIVSSALTTVGVIVGTPEYMSPEQCRGEPVDPRSDLYACGVLLYQLVTGHLPFMGDSVIDIALKHIRQAPPRPSNYLPSLHPGLETIILTALEKWPAQRQQSAAELKAALEEILPELRTTPYRGPAAIPPPAPVSSGMVRKHSTAIPIESVRDVTGDAPPMSERPAGTMRSPDPVAMRAAADRGGGSGEHVTITVPSPSGPPLASSPTVPAGPALMPTGTLTTGMPLPLPAPPMPGDKAAREARSLAYAATADEHALVPAAAPPQPPMRLWLLVPVALLVGITVGALVFFLTQ